MNSEQVSCASQPPPNRAAELLSAAQQAFGAGLVARAAELARDAVKAGSVGTSPAVQGHALLALARSLRHAGIDLEEAYAAACHAGELLQAAGDRAGELSADLMRASLLTGTGESEHGVRVIIEVSESAHREGLTRIAALAAFYLGVWVRGQGDLADCVHLFVDAAGLFQRAGDTDMSHLALVVAADTHAGLARRLSPGLLARTHLAAAAQYLPAPDTRDWRTWPVPVKDSMPSRASVMVALGDPGARSAVAVCIALWRHDDRSPHRYAYALGALSRYYEAAGQKARALSYYSRLVKVNREQGRAYVSGVQLERLAELQASVGLWGQALATRRTLDVERASLHHTQAPLRVRLAERERAFERRRQALREDLQHAGRLNHIGRLIAQIHHALHHPLAQAQRHLAEATGLAGNSKRALVSGALRAALADLSHATALVRQLSLFSRRDTPVCREVDLAQMLREAWIGLASHVGTELPVLGVGGDMSAQVESDPQRLGILLKLLLLELLQSNSWRDHSVDNSVACQATLHRLEAAQNNGDERTGGAVELRLLLAAPMGTQKDSVGLQLCQELARELGASFSPSEASPSEAPFFCLQLPPVLPR